jgi:glutamate dehydrogenase
LGYRQYDLTRDSGEYALRATPNSELGILRKVASTSRSFSQLPPYAREAARAKELLILTKSSSRSTVHRPVHLDYVGIRRFNDSGEVIGEHRFLGLYTSAAYSRRAHDIPVIRRKIAEVVERAELSPTSHRGKALLDVLENYPRDELFQIPAAELFATAQGIVHLQERQRVRLFVRRDPFGRFFSCLVFVPRDRFNTDLRMRIQNILVSQLAGISSEFSVQLSEALLARVHFIIHTQPGATPSFDVPALEARIGQALRSWKDELHDALIERFGEERGLQLSRRYGEAFPAGYRDDTSPDEAVDDIEKIESLAHDDLAMKLWRSAQIRFKLYRRGQPIALSDALPVLENMGARVIDERPHEIKLPGVSVWIHDFGIEVALRIDVDHVKNLFHDAFAQVWRGEIENDALNRLVLAAGLRAREVAVLRAYCRYLRQTATPYSLAFIEKTLNGHPQIAASLVKFFALRFDPARNDPGHADTHSQKILRDIDAVTVLDEDRVLRALFHLLSATLRTNVFQRSSDGAAKSYFSFKLDPEAIPELPHPRPKFEIFVYSTRMEGVHLRGGNVARGGLRWSDRREDFRSEVLSLMKAQMVKNAVIVPVGAKGGFVVKAPPTEREAWLKEGIHCYETFLRGLLDLTDNLIERRIVPPAGVVRRDSDDAYLVVAADKGTAAFSDIANRVAREYNFWLGDAFASGGSNGYDHKKMGITARGAWESVKRHFLEMGMAGKDFTVVGIGDMSGDVFGNGMLQSRHIKLVGAFDHRHIFLDPTPDTDASYRERERLFQLPRSSWADYDPLLISRGGGVYPRSAKAIAVTPEVKQALSVEADSLTPDELIRALVKAPVDLLYNGGIGTYVKAKSETNFEVGDRGNDAVRVNGMELRCQVVAEGGNLGFTQLGRIEYAMRGGRINTDAIDNSAGVDCSDHEVNIKIVLDSAVRNSELSESERNALLAQMTDEVAELVLRDNYFQALSLSISEARGPTLLDYQARFMRALEREGRLSRAIEFLPSEEEIAERNARHEGLVRPERAVLLAYSKLWLFDSLLASDLPDDPYVASALLRYFPQPLRVRFQKHIELHPLRREIIATHVVNSMVNRVGSTFVHRVSEETGFSPPDIVRSYLLTREAFGLVSLWKQIEALDGKLKPSVQIELLLEIGRFIARATRWFLHDRRGGIEETISFFAAQVSSLEARLDELIGETERLNFARAEKELRNANVPADLARRVAILPALYSALDLAEVTAESKVSIADAARIYFALADLFDFSWLRNQMIALEPQNHWQARAKTNLLDELDQFKREVLAAFLKRYPGSTLLQWQTDHARELARYRQVLADLKASGAMDFSTLSLALRELKAFVAGSS